MTHPPTPAPQAPAAPLTLVFGASGYVGTQLVAALRAQGMPVRAAARNRKVLEAREWQDVELVEADALAPASLAPVSRRMISPTAWIAESRAKIPRAMASS